MKKIVFPTLLVALPAVLNAGGPGASTAQILTLGAGARGAALAQTLTLYSDDAYSVFANPAGLGGLRRPEFGLDHAQWLKDVRHNAAVAAFPVKNLGTAALSYNRLSVDDFDSFDAVGGFQGSLRSASQALGLSWGKNLTPGAAPGRGLLGGVTFQSVREEVAGVSATGTSADVGFLWRPPSAGWIKRTSLGFTARRLGSGLTFDTENTPFPTEYTFGGAYSHFFGGDILTLGVEGRSAKAGNGVGAAGEYQFKDVLVGRAGWRSDGPEGTGLNAGLGLRFAGVQVDYAWTGLARQLGDVHRISVLFRFGPPLPIPGAAQTLYEEHRRTGKEHMDRGEYNEAILDFNEVLRIRPNDASAQSLLLECGRRLRETQ
jgi:hypothetical protein